MVAKRVVAVAFLLAALQLGVARTPEPASAALTGSLQQLPSPSGCLKSLARVSPNCPTVVDGQQDVSSVVVSPDGTFAYAASLYSSNVSSTGTFTSAPGGTITTFSRNPTTGALSEIGCIRDQGAPINPITMPCSTAAPGLQAAKTITLSPDGRFMYVAALESDAVTVLARNATTGALSFVGCVQTILEAAQVCNVTTNGLHGVRWVTLSADGRNLYASAPAADAIVAFSRNSTTGMITPLAGAAGCIEDNHARPDTGCTAHAAGLNYPRTITISPDGKNAYVASDHADVTYKDPTNPADGDAVAEFSRNTTTGALTPLPAPNNCIKDRQAVQSSLTSCAVGKGLYGAFNVAVSPDGKHVYVGGSNSNRGTLAEFSRNLTTGALTQLAGKDAWMSGNPTCNNFYDCTVVPPLLDGDAVTFANAGSIAYVASFHATGQVVVFNRNATTGVLSFSSCVRDPRATTLTMCTPTTGYMAGPRIAYVSPDGHFVYVPASVSYTLDSFRINP